MGKRKKSQTTFVVEIKDTEAHTWQGNLRWVETGKTSSFRSSMEMMKLIDSAIVQDDSAGISMG